MVDTALIKASPYADPVGEANWWANHAQEGITFLAELEQWRLDNAELPHLQGCFQRDTEYARIISRERQALANARRQVAYWQCLAFGVEYPDLDWISYSP